MRAFTALKTYFKSAELLFFFVGVPTQIKMIFDFFTDSARLDEKFNLDDELLTKAQQLSGLGERNELLREALREARIVHQQIDARKFGR